MAGKVAIVAHFDPADRIEPTVIELLKCVEQVFDRVLFVSTSALEASALSSLDKTETIERPNIGYDFYSYRVGLDRIWREGGAEQVLLLNTSILVLDPGKFTDALRRMSELAQTHGAVGATLSRQFAEHLQSYLLLLSRPVLDAPWFRDFVNTIEPLGDKMEIVQRYEIGLTAALKEHGASLASLFTPTPSRQKRQRQHGCVGAKQTAAPGRACVPARAPLPINTIQSSSTPRTSLARSASSRRKSCVTIRMALIFLSWPKRQVLNIQAGIDRLVEQTRHRYSPAQQGKLSTVATALTPIPAARTAVWGTPHARGVRLAVLVHAYFPDVLDEILGKLPNIVEPFDLYVTTPHEELVTPIFRLGAAYAASVTVAVSENRGRDIGPFLHLLRRGAFDGYLAVLKLHTKKSRYSEQGDAWRRSLVDELIGDSLKVRRAVALFESGKGSAGPASGPHADYLSHPSFWGSNRERVTMLLATLRRASARTRWASSPARCSGSRLTR